MPSVVITGTNPAYAPDNFPVGAVVTLEVVGASAPYSWQLRDIPDGSVASFSAPSAAQTTIVSDISGTYRGVVTANGVDVPFAFGCPFPLSATLPPAAGEQFESNALKGWSRKIYKLYQKVEALYAGGGASSRGVPRYEYDYTPAGAETFVALPFYPDDIGLLQFSLNGQLQYHATNFTHDEDLNRIVLVLPTALAATDWLHFSHVAGSLNTGGTPMYAQHTVTVGGETYTPLYFTPTDASLLRVTRNGALQRLGTNYTYNTGLNRIDWVSPATLAADNDIGVTHVDNSLTAAFGTFDLVAVGGETSIVLSATPPDLTALRVYLNGLLLKRNLHYTVSGATVTFVEPTALIADDWVFAEF